MLTKRKRQISQIKLGPDCPQHERDIGLLAGCTSKSVDAYMSRLNKNQEWLDYHNNEKRKLLAAAEELEQLTVDATPVEALTVGGSGQGLDKGTKLPGLAAKPLGYTDRIRRQLSQLDELNSLLSKGIAEASQGSLDLPMTATLSKIVTDGIVQLSKLRDLLPDPEDDPESEAGYVLQLRRTYRYAYAWGIHAAVTEGEAAAKARLDLSITDRNSVDGHVETFMFWDGCESISVPVHDESGTVVRLDNVVHDRDRPWTFDLEPPLPWDGDDTEATVPVESGEYDPAGYGPQPADTDDQDGADA